MHEGFGKTFSIFHKYSVNKTKLHVGCIQRSAVFHFLLFCLCHVNRINATWPNKTNILIELEAHLSTPKALPYQLTA